jgi:hypothetical protein
MTLRTSRRRAMQAALITAAAVTLPRAAKPAAPTESGDATITAAQVQAALGRLDALIENGMTKTAVPGTAVAVVHNDTVVYERGFGVRELQNRAAPHFRTQAGVWKPGNLTNDDAAMPAGGVSSSLRDLTLWLRLQVASGMFDGRQVVASGPLRETRRPQIVAISPPDPSSGATKFYGLGWLVFFDDRGRLVVQHGGDFYGGYHTQATLLPAAGLGIVVLCNGWPSALRDAIPNAFLEMVTHGEPRQDWVSATETSFAAALASMVQTSTTFPQGKPPAGSAPPLPLDAYTGKYSNTIYGEVTVREKDGGLVVEFGPNGTRRPIFPWNRDAFVMPFKGADAAAQVAQLGVFFTIGAAGQADAALVSLGGVGPDAAATFTRVGPPRPDEERDSD